jgi:hypothetical protein
MISSTGSTSDARVRAEVPNVHSLASPAHRVAVAFLRGGLLAIVALLAAPRAAALVRSCSTLEDLGDLAAALLPVAGFLVAWAFGGAALDRGRRGVRAFAVGGLVAGMLMSAVWPQLAGLTGREPLPALLAFSVGGWAVAFGAGGGLAGWGLDRRAAAPLAARFAAGGALGALLFIAPSLAQPLGVGTWSGPARLLLTTVTSVAGLLTPFAVGGAAAGRLLGRD